MRAVEARPMLAGQEHLGCEPAWPGWSIKSVSKHSNLHISATPQQRQRELNQMPVASCQSSCYRKIQQSCAIRQPPQLPIRWPPISLCNPNRLPLAALAHVDRAAGSHRKSRGWNRRRKQSLRGSGDTQISQGVYGNFHAVMHQTCNIGNSWAGLRAGHFTVKTALQPLGINRVTVQAR